MFELMSPVEFHVITPGIEPVGSRSGGRQNLQWRWPFQVRIALRTSLKKFICAEVHHHKLSAIQEADAVRDGLQSLGRNVQRDFVPMIGLSFFLYRGRVVGA